VSIELWAFIFASVALAGVAGIIGWLVLDYRSSKEWGENEVRRIVREGRRR
jgi:hypothetical protein